MIGDPTDKVPGFNLKRSSWVKPSTETRQTKGDAIMHCLNGQDVIVVQLNDCSHIILFCPDQFFEGDFEEVHQEQYTASYTLTKYLT